ncbi:hypothetical protein PZA11_004379 [Diplocarpon coronariae]|uniref:Ketoreductase domain-containing protein n=1 Tax=Diplocarpon coronariae TaxID=2795749 RepID=A0A218YZT6_9HELO|nr:hypothetical protein B2J93_4314 [Marssonina coronariae]
MSSGFPYKTVLVLGATSGIGLALAEKLVENGSHVVAVGRRAENLASLQQKHGKDRVSIAQFDVTDLAGIPAFADSITKSHPALDGVVVNAGIQRRLDLTNPPSIDLAQVSAELTTNYLSPVHLVTAFLPHLQRQPTPTSLIFTTSGLALVPILRCPNYCASKAALHHLILCLREQLRAGGSRVKVVEVLPPAVQTELHDSKHQPDIKDGGSMGMPLDEFTDEMWTGLCAGKTDVPVGMAKKSYEGWEGQRQSVFRGMVEEGLGAL